MTVKTSDRSLVMSEPGDLRSSTRTSPANCRPHCYHSPSHTGVGDDRSRDQPQHLMEHLPRRRDLGHLEHDVTAMADDLGADLDKLIRQTRQAPRLCCRGHRQGSRGTAEVVGQYMELKANHVGG